MAATAIDFHSVWSERLDVTGARVCEVQFTPNRFCPMHWHKRPSLGIVFRGEISKQFRDGSVVVPANAGYSMPPGIAHSDHFAPDSRAIVIEIDPRHPMSAERLERCSPLFDAWHELQDRQLRWLGRRLAAELRSPDRAAALAIDGLIGEILSVATRSITAEQPGQPPSWLLEAREIAQAEINRRVSVAEIAARVGVHPAYLARRFRAEFGVTPGTFARNARLDWAANRLLEADLSIAEIAIQAGFSDQSHFTRAFRQYLERTPAQYRQVYRSNGRGRQ